MSNSAIAARDRLTVAPEVEPISVAELKTHLRIGGTASDADLARKLAAAREFCEDLQGRAYITQTRTVTLHAFPCARRIALPRAPLQSVTHVKYTTEDGELLTFASSNYVVDTVSEPGAIWLKSTADWPTDELAAANGVTIEYICGYGYGAGSEEEPAAGAPTGMPRATLQAIELLVGHLFENREATGDQSAGNVTTVPLGFEALISQNRLWRFA